MPLPRRDDQSSCIVIDEQGRSNGRIHVEAYMSDDEWKHIDVTSRGEIQVPTNEHWQRIAGYFANYLANNKYPIAQGFVLSFSGIVFSNSDGLNWFFDMLNDQAKMRSLCVGFSQCHAVNVMSEKRVSGSPLVQQASVVCLRRCAASKIPWWCSMLSALAESQALLVMRVNVPIFQPGDSATVWLAVADFLDRSQSIQTLDLEIDNKPDDADVQAKFQSGLAASRSLRMLNFLCHSQVKSFVCQLEKAVVASAVKTRGRMHAWKQLPCALLANVCLYVQHIMPRLKIVINDRSGTSHNDNDDNYDDDIDAVREVDEESGEAYEEMDAEQHNPDGSSNASEVEGGKSSAGDNKNDNSSNIDDKPLTVEQYRRTVLFDVLRSSCWIACNSAFAEE